MNYLTIEKFQPRSPWRNIRILLLVFILLVVPFTITIVWVLSDFTQMELADKIHTVGEKEFVRVGD